MSQRAYARHRLELGLTGTTHRAVQKALERGRIQKNPDGLIDSEEADKQWAANTDVTDGPGLAPSSRQVPRETEAPPAPGGVTFAHANAIEKAYKAKLAKLKFEEQSGKLVSADDVLAEWQTLVVMSRTRLLALPSKIKARLPHITRQDVTEIEGLIREALDQLSEADD